MTFSISLNFDSTDDLQKFLNVIKEGGFDKFIKKTKYKKTSTSKNRESHEDTVESSLVTRLRSTILFQSFDSHYSSCSVFNNHSRR